MLVLMLERVRGAGSNKSNKERNNKGLVELHDEKRQRCKRIAEKKMIVMV